MKQHLFNLRFAFLLHFLTNHVESLAFHRHWRSSIPLPLTSQGKQQRPNYVAFSKQSELDSEKSWRARRLSNPRIEAAVLETAEGRQEEIDKSKIESTIVTEESLSDAYNKYATENTKFHREIVSVDSDQQIADDHSAIQMFRSRIADSDE